LIVDRDSIIQLSDSSVIVMNHTAEGADESREFRYVDFTLIREAVRKLVRALVEYWRDELFPDMCGSCGKCCMGRFVRVSAKERQLIEQYLLMEGRDGHREFLAETATWNEQDGLLIKEDGRCVFLRDRISGSRYCEIYPVRPHQCLSISPVMEICEKDTGKLIYHLDTIHIQGDTVLFMRKSKATLERVLDSSPIKGAVEELRMLCASVEDPGPAPSEEQARKEADRKLRLLRYDYIRHGETPLFLERVKEITDYLNGLNREMPVGDTGTGQADSSDGEIFPHGDNATQALEALPSTEASYEQLESNNDEVGTSGRRIENEEPVITISLGSESAFLKVESGDACSEFHIVYRDNEGLLPAVRRFMQVFVQSGDKAMLDALWHPDPYCFMCGECCRIYKVEISPYDVELIAEHLNLPKSQMWRTHVHPSIFSWNEADGILAKKDGSRLDVQKSFAPCIFLCEEKPGIQYCSIYRFRPEICRSYSADSDKCRILCQLKKWESLIENIVTLEISGFSAALTTRQTHMQGKPPHPVSLLESDELKECYVKLRDILLDIARNEDAVGGPSPPLP
jgi:Fe-S-cluster containining protein